MNIQKERRARDTTETKLTKFEEDKTWMIALDIGCGTGLLAEAISQHASIVMGVDLSTGMLSRAEDLGIYSHLYSGDMIQWLNALGSWWVKEGYLPKTSTTTTIITDEDEDDGVRRKSSGSIIRDVPSTMNMADAPGLQPLLDTHVRLGPLLIVAADVFVYVGELSEVFKAVSVLLSNSGSFIFTTEHLLSSNSNGYQLQPSGRFAHTKEYLMRLAYEHDLVLNSMTEVTPRVENGRPVDGLLVVLSKN